MEYAIAMRTANRLLALSALLSLLSTLPAFSDEAKPTGEDLIRGFAETLTQSTNLQFQISSEMKIKAGEMDQEMKSVYALSLAKPSRLALRFVDGSETGIDLITDGTTLILNLPMMDSYVEEPAPETLEELSENPAWMMSAAASMGGIDLLTPLVRANAYDLIMEGVLRTETKGEEQIAGQRAFRVHLEQEDIDVDLWFSAEAPTRLLQARPDLTKAYGEMAKLNPDMQNLEISVTIRFSDWVINEELPAAALAFTPPPGAEKIASLSDAFGIMDEEPEAESIGQPAPPFELDLLSGGKARLSDHLGKDIVLLDFWATWCPPCVRALPLLVDVAEAYREKGVVFYAVNQQEDAKTVERFLKAQKLSMPVAMDAKGEVGDLYGVTGIPQTVLIGRDGLIADVHVGFAPDLKEILSERIDELLAGGSQGSDEQPTDQQE